MRHPYLLVTIPVNDESDHTLRMFIEQLRYAGIIEVEPISFGTPIEEEAGPITIHLYSPNNKASKESKLTWCETNAARMRTFGYRAATVVRHDDKESLNLMYGKFGKQNPESGTGNDNREFTDLKMKG